MLDQTDLSIMCYLHSLSEQRPPGKPGLEGAT